MTYMDEFSLIERMKRKVPSPKHAVLGIGDDAAMLKKIPAQQLVISTDMLVENVDFVLKKLSPEKIGRKALAVNLSDLAAMGAEPVAFVLSIGKPKHISARWIERFYEGMLKLAKQYKVDCIGGDFSSAKEFSVSVTILGKAKRVVTRSGAKPGDWIGVTGTLGGSILKKHYDFSPRVQEGIALNKNRLANAMIDISDGLYQDLQHILCASRVATEIDLETIPISSDARRMARNVILRSAATKNLRRGSFAFCKAQDDEAFKRALTEGEDFELLFAASPSAKKKLEKIWKKKFPRVPLVWVGKIVKGKPEVVCFSGDKKVQLPNLDKKGFKHF